MVHNPAKQNHHLASSLNQRRCSRNTEDKNRSLNKWIKGRVLKTYLGPKTMNKDIVRCPYSYGLGLGCHWDLDGLGQNMGLHEDLSEFGLHHPLFRCCSLLPSAAYSPKIHLHLQSFSPCNLIISLKLMFQKHAHNCSFIH